MLTGDDIRYLLFIVGFYPTLSIVYHLYCQYFLSPQIASLGTRLRSNGAIWVQSYVVMVQSGYKVTL